MNRLALFTALLVFSLLSGCAEKPAIKYVWPPPPEQPRMEWIGNFYSEDDLKASQKYQGVKKFILGDIKNRPMTSPFGISSDGEGKVYVSDIHKHNVHIFDMDKGTVDALADDGVFDTPIGVAIDTNKNIYIADGVKNMVMVFSPEGNPLFSFGKDIFVKPAYIDVDDSLGRIYISDSKGHTIRVFDMQGEYLFDIGKGGNEPGEFHTPQGVAVAPNGNLYVADMFHAKIQYFSPEGEYLGEFGERGDQINQFEHPKDLAFDTEGHLYIIDSKSARLALYTQEGRILLALGSGGHSGHALELATPKSIFIDNNDRIYISEMTNRRFTVWQYYSEAYLQRQEEGTDNN